MSAYVVVDIEITDAVTYEEYRRIAPPSIAAYGGKYLARGGTTQVLEGGWTPKRLVILEFPDAERARAWIDSPEYADARALRWRSARTNMILTEGLAVPVA